MEKNYHYVDINDMPTHLLVKSQKQAKKIEKQQDAVSPPGQDKMGTRFKLTFEN